MVTHNDLALISNRYFKYGGEGFTKKVLAHLRILPGELNPEDIRAFANEINLAAGKILSPEQKNKFKEEILALIK